MNCRVDPDDISRNITAGAERSIGGVVEWAIGAISHGNDLWSKTGFIIHDLEGGMNHAEGLIPHRGSTRQIGTRIKSLGNHRGLASRREAESQKQKKAPI